MKRDLIKGWRFMFCGVSKTMNLVCMVLFFLLGIFLEVISVLTGVFGGEAGRFMRNFCVFSSMILFCSAMFPAQLITSMDITLLAQSSAYKKKMQTSIPCLWTLISNLVVMSVIILIRGIMTLIMPEHGDMIFSNLYICGVTGFILAFYSAFVYKYFIASLVGLYVGIMIYGIGSGFHMATNMIEGSEVGGGGLPVFLSVPLCFGLIFVGSALQYLVTTAAYKRNFSKYAFGSSVKKLM